MIFFKIAKKQKKKPIGLTKNIIDKTLIVDIMVTIQTIYYINALMKCVESR